MAGDDLRLWSMFTSPVYGGGRGRPFSPSGYEPSRPAEGDATAVSRNRDKTYFGSAAADRPAWGSVSTPAPTRHAFADNLKVVLVAGVVVTHVTMAWAGLDGAWVFSEPPVREPLLSVLDLVTIVAAAFGMPLFFLVAGMFTPASLQRKGLRRYAVDRTVRLLVPSLLFVALLTPPIEYVDPDAGGWTGGFWAFVPHVWSLFPPAPGPTWFLGVLLVFSLVYGVVRTVRPRVVRQPQPLQMWQLATAAAVVAVASFSIRIIAPLGHEVWHWPWRSHRPGSPGLPSVCSGASVGGSSRSSRTWPGPRGGSGGQRSRSAWWWSPSSRRGRARTCSSVTARGSRWPSRSSRARSW